CLFCIHFGGRLESVFCFDASGLMPEYTNRAALANIYFPWNIDLQGEAAALKILLHKGKESLGVRSVDDTMIIRESEVSHLPDGDVVVAFGGCEDLRTLFDRPDAEDRDLRLIDDRCSEQSAEHAGARYCECSAGDFVRVELLQSRAIREIIRCEGEARGRKSGRLFDDRQHQAPVESHRHSEIYIALVNDVLAIDLRVHDRELPDRIRDRLEDKRHVRQLRTVARLELSLVLLAQLSD